MTDNEVCSCGAIPTYGEGHASSCVAAKDATIAELRARLNPQFKELSGTEIPADELTAAKKFAEFDGKEQMMCGWQSVHREVHVLYHALLKSEAQVAELRKELEAKVDDLTNCGDNLKVVEASPAAVKASELDRKREAVIEAARFLRDELNRIAPTIIRSPGYKALDARLAALAAEESR